MPVGSSTSFGASLLTSWYLALMVGLRWHSNTVTLTLQSYYQVTHAVAMPVMIQTSFTFQPRPVMCIMLPDQ